MILDQSECVSLSKNLMPLHQFETQTEETRILGININWLHFVSDSGDYDCDLGTTC